MNQEQRWNLTLMLDGPDGTRLAMTLPMDHMQGMELARINPLSVYDMFTVGDTSPMERVVEIIRKRTYRKDFFKSACLRLGTLLAERMEDAEGWHGESRVDSAKQQLRGR